MNRSTAFRQRLKENDPERYREYLDKQKARVKVRREKLKKELQKKTPCEAARVQKQHELQLQRTRQKKWLEKKKMESNGSIKTPPRSIKKSFVETRHSIQSKRDYNREMKRKERMNQSYQKKMWIRKKDRDRKALKREALKRDRAAHMQPACPANSPMSPFTSKKTEWNTTSKVRQIMPNSPVKFAKVILNLEQRASPRKKKAIYDLKEADSKRKNDRNGLKKIPSRKSSCKKAATRLVKRSLRRRSRVDVLGIQKFFMRDDISRILPQKRYATKDGPGYSMQVSLQAAHSKYNFENPSKAVSLGKFAALRKRNVRLLKVSYREYCCCVYCINVRYKMLSLSRAMTGQEKKHTSEMDIQDIVLCPKRDGQRFHDPACINGVCKDCKNYQHKLSEYYKNIPEEKPLTWCRWEYEKNEMGRSKRVVVTRKGTKQECLKEFLEHDILKPALGTNFFQHLHTARWQADQFNKIKQELPSGDILQVMDFAKNREVKYQDEVKSAFYTASQITLHPIVTYYKSNIGLVRHSSIVISEDNVHDHHAVHHFQKVVDHELENTLGCKPNRKVIFSDGCSSQYKSKGPLADMAHSNDIKVNRNYFGSEHGKGDCDADIGIVNKALDRAIVGRQVQINNAQDLYEYCKFKLEIDDVLSKRTFHYVRLGEIHRDRSDVTNIKTVQNTRKIHQVLNVRSSNDTLEVRNLSCFCHNCEVGDPDCFNSKYVNQFELKTLIPERPRCQDRPSDLDTESSRRNGSSRRGRSENKRLNVQDRLPTDPDTELSRRNGPTRKGKSETKQLDVQDMQPTDQDTELSRRNGPTRKGKSETKQLDVQDMQPTDQDTELSRRNGPTRKGKSETKQLDVQDMQPTDPDTELTHRNGLPRKGKSETKQLDVQDMQPTDPDTELSHRNGPTRKGKSETKQLDVQDRQSTDPDTESRRNGPTREIRPINFKNVLETMEQATTFQGLKQMVMSFKEENVMKDLEVQGKSYSVVQLSACIDQYAKDLMPDEIWEQEILRVPVRVFADGNCLPRCGSIFSFGTEDHHQEIRARIVMEMVENSDMYLDYKFLSKGLDETIGTRAEQLPNHFAMYSDKFVPDSKLTPSTVRSIYEQEVVDITRNSVYMGIWQLFGLASVLRCNVQSVYPNLGNPHVREDLNRLIKPRGTETNELVHILWSTTRSDMIGMNWIPNHFVPLLPISKHDEVLFSDSEEEIEESKFVLEILQNLQYDDDPDDEGLPAKSWAQSESLTFDEQMSQTEDQPVSDDPIADSDNSVANLHESPSVSSNTALIDDTVDEPYHTTDDSDTLWAQPESPTGQPDVLIGQTEDQPVSDDPIADSDNSGANLHESPSISRYTTQLEDFVAELEQAIDDSDVLRVQTESPTGQPDNQRSHTEDQPESEKPMDQSNAKPIPKARYNIGTHLSVNVGRSVLAAVVVQCPEEMQPSDVGVWVQFFEERKTFSVLAEKPFFVLFEDIVGRMREPSLQLVGSRIVYKFEKDL